MEIDGIAVWTLLDGSADGCDPPAVVLDQARDDLGAGPSSNSGFSFLSFMSAALTEILYSQVVQTIRIGIPWRYPVCSYENTLAACILLHAWKLGRGSPTDESRRLYQAGASGLDAEV